MASPLPVILALARREVLIRATYRATFVLEGFGGVLAIAVYYFISETFKDVEGAGLGDAPSYFAFALVGAAITTVVQTAATTTSRRVREEQLTGTLEAMLSQPVRSGEVAFGLAAYPFLFAALRALAYLVLGSLLPGVDFVDADWLGLILVLIVATALFLAIGLMIAAIVVVLKRAEVIAGLIMYALAVLGGAFFPVSVLPGWLEWLSDLAPTRRAFDGGRDALYGGGGWADDVLVLSGMALVLIPVGLWLFDVSVRSQRRSGALGEY